MDVNMEQTERPRFFDIFKRYTPSEEKRAVLCRGEFIRPPHKVGGDPLCWEAELSFPRHVDAELLYEAEAECAEVYGMTSVRLFPHFPSSEFSLDRFNELSSEAALCGAVTMGFFRGAQLSDDGQTITVRIPFAEGGVAFVRRANTEQLMSNILRSRYGVVRNFVIEQGDHADEHSRQLEQRRAAAMEEAQRENVRRLREQQQAREQEAQERARAEDPTYDFERRSSLIQTQKQAEEISEGIFRLGLYTYDCRDATLICGETFDINEPNTLSAADRLHGSALFIGTVFELTSKESRSGDRLSMTVGICDGVSAIYIRKISPPEEAAWFSGLKVGTHVAVFGYMKTDKYDSEPFLSLKSMMKVGRVERTDTAAEKRVELHLHSNMSQMDAIITPEQIVNTAIRWGHSAIAVTDHGNVQAFPEIMLALEKSKHTDLKILYGMEAYFVNDTARCLFGKDYPSFDDDMVVFDIETTGLSNLSCRIIEIGAVRIRAGQIVDTMDIFVDPECPIPEHITALTSITDDMVRGAAREEEAVRAFLAFAGDAMLIAHNAAFDVGFIRVACERHGIAFPNTYLDTFGLSKYVNPELKRHKLDVIAEAYKLGEFHHHRASDDATVLARIFFVMLDRLRGEGIRDFERMQEAMSEKTDPLKLPTYHAIIFAKDEHGLKNLYKLISHSYLDYFHRFPRIPKSLLEEYREGLILGSACEAGELYRAVLDGRAAAEIEEIADFYDYFEIQPLSNNRFLVADGKVANEQTLQDINRRIVALGKKLGKPVCATCDAHFLDKEDEIYRKILLAGMKFRDADKDVGLYLRTTEEMLEEFSYLGEEDCRAVVIDNPNKIAAMCKKIRPIPTGRYEPDLPGAKEELVSSCWARAKDWYGDPLPAIVEKRLKRELDSIIDNGFAVLYMIAVKLVAYSEKLGYLVGSRGSVGSSFVATMSGISEVNPLPPHYRCPKCRHSEFITDGTVGSGFDLPDKVCPACATPMIIDGHDIPFETFLGFHGDKSPDIDLNFSGDVQGRVHKFTEELFGEGHVFRAGTIGTLADKTAWGYISKYLEERKLKLPKAQMSHMVTRMVGIKRTTGQHPGGIIVVPKEYDIYDFSPVQHPADDPHSDIVTTHFQFSYLHDTILKLDELGHDMPTKYKMLEKYTGTSVLDVKMNDSAVYELFHSVKPLNITPEQIGGCQLGTFGIPEMGTRFAQQVLIDSQPKNFADLLQIMGLTHGTDVWLGNAQDLIKSGTCTISEVVGTRDGIMLYLIRHGLDDSMSFKIMEDVRKGRGVKPEYEAAMLEHDVPTWYIESCKKIKYMFPKAHAAAYAMSAIRLCWYKIYYPLEFYAAFLTVAPGGFDAEIVGRGYRGVCDAIREIEEKGMDATAKENEMASTLQLVREALARGIAFAPVDLHRSDAKAFLPEDGKIRMPFNSLGGLGDTAAAKIAQVRSTHQIYSVEDLRQYTGISKAVIEILRRNGVLDSLMETNQFSLF